MLIAESGSGFGGTAKYLESLLPFFRGRNFRVEIAAYGKGPFIQEIARQGWTVHSKSSWAFDSNAAGVAKIIFLAMPIAAWLRKKRIRAVHLNNEILSHLPLIAGAKLAGCRILCHLHGWRPFTKIERVFLPAIDRFICISESGAKYFGGQLNGRKVTAVPNGLNPNGKLNDLEKKRQSKRKELGLQDDDIAVAILGRLVPWKGQEIFIRALAEAARKNPMFTGLIIGHDPSPGQAYLQDLRALARELKIESRVKFLNFQDDVWPFYAAADIVVHASTQPEPFGLVILEAMFAGKPVVAADGGGVSDMVVDGETGLLVKPGSWEDLAAALGRLQQDRQFADHLTHSAKERAERLFTMERNAEQVAAIYGQLI